MKEKIKRLIEAISSLKVAFIKKMEKPVKIFKIIFGYGIMASLFIGALTLLGYIIAFIIGGEGAALICDLIKKYIIPAITYLSTSMVAFGILIMYLSGESALAAKKKNTKFSNKKSTAVLNDGKR